MTYSYNYINSLHKAFSIHRGDVKKQDLNIVTTISCNSELDSMIMPTFYGIVLNNQTKVVNLYHGVNATQKKTVDSMLRLAFEISVNNVMHKIRANNGSIYYMGKGIIMDKDFNILFLSAVEWVKKLWENGGITFHINSYLIYLNPKVFTNSTCIVCKSIKNKVIPCYLENPIYIKDRHSPLYGKNVIPTIRIEDPKIILPDLPKLSSIDAVNLDAVLNELLINNINQII